MNSEALSIARERLPRNDFHEASADELPLVDGSAHGYRAVRVIHYLPDAAAALAEARRVLVPGARAVVVGHDYGMAAIESDDRGQAERIVRAVESASNPANAGRHYRSMMASPPPRNFKGWSPAMRKMRSGGDRGRLSSRSPWAAVG